jgi:hypothetical protein
MILPVLSDPGSATFSLLGCITDEIALTFSPVSSQLKWNSIQVANLIETMNKPKETSTINKLRHMQGPTKEVRASGLSLFTFVTV